MIYPSIAVFPATCAQERSPTKSRIMKETKTLYKIVLLTLYTLMPFASNTAANNDIMHKTRALNNAKEKLLLDAQENLILFIQTITKQTDIQTKLLEDQKRELGSFLLKTELDIMTLGKMRRETGSLKKQQKITAQIEKMLKESTCAEEALKKLDATKQRIDAQHAKIENAQKILAQLQHPLPDSSPSSNSDSKHQVIALRRAQRKA